VISSANNTPPLYGLVLAGGKSTRMGYDKSAIQWHGKEQRYYMADMLTPLCDKVFISCKTEQQNDIVGDYNTITDSCEGAGPLIAILSAFKAIPHVAWLVIACDLPLIETITLQYLIQNRNTAAAATTFKSPFDGLPEPLITIWEPSAYDMLLAHKADGYSCPRKALIRNEHNIAIITPPDPSKLMNANTPEDAEQARKILNSIKNTKNIQTDNFPL
jgi:molybdopterin-guanine dinucleotide biosynthesis protein A